MSKARMTIENGHLRRMSLEEILATLPSEKEIALWVIEEYCQPSIQRTRPEKERHTIPDLKDYLTQKEMSNE